MGTMMVPTGLACVSEAAVDFSRAHSERRFFFLVLFLLIAKRKSTTKGKGKKQEDRCKWECGIVMSDELNGLKV